MNIRSLLIVLVVLMSGCVDISYKNPNTGEEFVLKTFAKTAKAAQVIVASKDKVVAVSIGETANDPILDQVGDIIDRENN
jgi:hypothetical protein